MVFVIVLVAATTFLAIGLSRIAWPRVRLPIDVERGSEPDPGRSFRAVIHPLYEVTNRDNIV
jgi:hypothetical protein